MTAHSDHREYSEDEKHALTSNLTLVAGEVHRGEWSNQAISPPTLAELHRRIFRGVRAHAGRPRGAGWGAERLTFGPNRSHHRDDVASALDAVFREARVSIQSLLDNQEDPDYERSAIHVAVWLHAEIVRIHPFEDGNGRSSRLVMAQVLVRLGLRPIPIEATKQEYTTALNTYFRSNSIELLVDLFLRLADPQHADDYDST